MMLAVTDILLKSGEYEAVFLILESGALSAELDLRGIRYNLLGNQTMPSGIKGKNDKS